MRFGKWQWFSLLLFVLPLSLHPPSSIFVCTIYQKPVEKKAKAKAKCFEKRQSLEKEQEKKQLKKKNDIFLWKHHVKVRQICVQKKDK